MRFIPVVLALLAIIVVTGNLWLAFRRARTGRGPAPVPLLATIFGVCAVALIRHAFWLLPLGLAILLVDFGSWVAAGWLFRRR